MLQMAMEAAHRPLLEEKYADDPDDLKVAKSLAYHADADFKNAVHLLKKIEREVYNEYKDAILAYVGSIMQFVVDKPFLSEVMQMQKNHMKKRLLLGKRVESSNMARNGSSIH